MTSKFFALLAITAFIAGASAGLPKPTPASCSLAQSLASTTLNDGSTVWACGGGHWGSVMRKPLVGSAVMVATITDPRTVGQPWTQAMLNGAVCPVIYWHHGNECFEGIAKRIFPSLLPANNATVAEFENIFTLNGQVTFPGQFGTCYYGYGYNTLFTTGLTQYGAANAQTIRSGLIDMCETVTYDTRTVMSALWGGIALIIVSTVSLILGCVALPSNLAVVGCCGGGVYNKVSS